MHIIPRVFPFIAAAMMSLSGQGLEVKEHTEQLLEHWRWEQYWFSKTEIGISYRSGYDFNALLFWPKRSSLKSVGLCSSDLKMCLYYPDTAGRMQHFKMNLEPRWDLRSAYKEFVSRSFAQAEAGVLVPEAVVETDYNTSVVHLTLSSIDQPVAIRRRIKRPRAQLDALLNNLSCEVAQPGCTLHIKIPYYSESDPWVPVYRECQSCIDRAPMIIFMRIIDGRCWHGAQDFDKDPEFVKLTAQRIDSSLMFEVRR